MAIEHPPRLYSYDDYAAIEDDRRYQVIEGELFMTPSANIRHHLIQTQLVVWLSNHARSTRSGTVMISPDIVLRAERPATVVQPDALFLSNARAGLLTEANLQGAPDLVVEVLSPSTARLDLKRKLPLYASYGVREAWIVPLRADRVDVYRRDEATGAFGEPTPFVPGDVLTSDLLPGLSIPVADLFEAPPPASR